MKKLWVALVIVLLAGGGALALKKFKGTAPEAAPTKAFKDDAPKTLAQQQSAAAALSVEVAASDLTEAETREVRRELPLTGQLRPVHVALVRAKVAGEVTQMLVKEGETVKKGQVLARLDAAEHQARLDERSASLAASKATWENNERTRKNNEELLRKGFISQQAYDNTLANSSVALAQMKAAEANVALARKSVTDTVVKAPWSGLIAERAVQVGDKASVDTRLLTIVDLSRMEIEAAVPASDIPSVEPGQAVNFKVEGFGARAFTGVIARVNPQSAAGSRSIMVYIEVPNSDGALKGGMFAKGGLTLTKREAVTAVPVSALREERGETVVYAVVDNKLARLPVKTGTRNEEEAWVEIVQGLQAGVKVVKTNLGALNGGATVRIAGEKGQAVPGAAAVLTGNAATATLAVPSTAAATVAPAVVPAAPAPGASVPAVPAAPVTPAAAAPATPAPPADTGAK